MKIHYNSFFILILVMFVQSHARTTPPLVEEMRWDQAEKEVSNNRFLPLIIDSIRTANEIPNNKGLIPSTGSLPFPLNEQLVFDGGWGVIRAGFAIINFRRDEDRSTFRITAKVVSNNFVSNFYRVRDFVEAHIDIFGLYPVFFEQHIREGRFREDAWTMYDPIRRQVFASKKEIATPASPFTHNYLSLLYYLRTQSFAVGDTFVINCFIHGADYPVIFRVLAREPVTVEAGIFDCFKIEPQLVGEGRGFTKRDKMLLWLTADKKHMPVLITAKINIGTVSARLISYSR
jgi:hypothetical protein